MNQIVLKPAKVRCTLATFWLGYRDYRLERKAQGPAGLKGAARTPFRSSLGLAAVVVGGIVVTQVVVAALGPTIAKGLNVFGTAAIAWVCQLLGLLLAMTVFIWIPTRYVLKGIRFCGDMCQRGQELQAGVRTAQTLLYEKG